MGFTLGSLAVMSGFWPLEHSSLSRVFALFELRSMFLAVVVFLVLLVLAYLTNPSEASFRTFLTEQAFRHHLSRLDDVDAIDEYESSNRTAMSYALSRRGLSRTLKNRAITAYSSPPFPFATRASVSLRTPKHIFRSFCILSVAAVVPTSPSNRSSSTRRTNGDEIVTRADKESGPNSFSTISDSWFVGAFGMWFWTFNLDGLWRDAGLVAKDEVDGTIAGVLGIKALDRSDEYNRTSYISYGNGNGNGNSSTTQRPSPKLRSRDRISHQGGNALNHRSQTPPPLPKSASLPLHTKRGPHVSTSEKSTSGRNHHSSNSFALSSAPSVNGEGPISITPEFRSINASAPAAIVPSASPSAIPSRSPSVLFASSPLIAELLRQLSSSQNAISDLDLQLSDFNSSSASTRAALDDELEKQRERKRADDTAKAELKAQTKTLEDQKRTTEAARRDAEKRLRVARSEKDNVDTRIEHYECEISKLQSQVEAQGIAIITSGVETAAAVADLEQQIDAKRSEVRTVEDEVAQLSLHLREMEEKVASEEHRLKDALAEAGERKQKSVQLQMMSPNAAFGEKVLQLSPVRGSIPDSPVTAPSLDTQAHHVSRAAPPIPAPLDAGLANGFPMLSSAFNPQLQRRGSLSQRFAPFSSDFPSPGPLSPTGESLIPSSLYEPLGMGSSNNSLESPLTASDMSTSRSFQSEDDMILDRNWLSRRNSTAGDVGQPLAFPSLGSTAHNSPVSPAGSTHVYDGFDAFSVDHSLRERASSLRMDAQRASFPSKFSTTDFFPHQAMITSDHVEPVAAATTRRTGWFSSHKEKGAKVHEKKGLNPGAKEFSLSKEKERSFSAFLSRSHGPGSGHGSNSGSSSAPSTASIPTPEPPSLVNSPPLSSAMLIKNPSPQTQRATPARTAGSLLSLGSSWFGSSRAFAPTPLEREQFNRALGGTVEKLERLPSLPTSPQPSHAPAHNQSVVSLPPRPWVLGQGSDGSKTSTAFCPFDDEPTAHSGESNAANGITDAGKCK